MNTPFSRGHGDAGELADLVGAVDGGGLVDIAGQPLDAAHEDQHEVTHRTEAEGHQQAVKLDAAVHVVGFGQGVRPEKGEQIVQKAKALVIDVVDPHGGNGHGVDDVGDVDDGCGRRFCP